MNQDQILEAVQALAAELGIEAPYVIVAAREEIWRIESAPDEVTAISHDDYRTLVTKIRRGSKDVKRTTFFDVNEETSTITVRKDMGMRGSCMRRTYQIEKESERFSFKLTSSMIMA